MSSGGGDDPVVLLRSVEDGDIEVFFHHQADPEAVAMAAFPAREREQFFTHWAKIRADNANIMRTIVTDGVVAGNVVSWEQDGIRLVGYWLGREHWGRGVATRALRQLVAELSTRPLYAHVAKHNLASIRVLEKCGFQRGPESQATQPPSADGIEEIVLVLLA